MVDNSQLVGITWMIENWFGIFDEPTRKVSVALRSVLRRGESLYHRELGTHGIRRRNGLTPPERMISADQSDQKIDERGR